MPKENDSIPQESVPVLFLLAPVCCEEEGKLQKTIVKELITRLSNQTDGLRKFAFLRIGHRATAQPDTLSDTLPLIQRPSLLDIDNAFSLLNQALSRKAMLDGSYGICLPLLFYVGNCNQDISKKTKLLNDNRWFQLSTRIAICFEEESKQYLAQFCKSSEACFCVDNERRVFSTVDVIVSACRPISFSGSILASPDDNFVRVDPVESDSSNDLFDDDYSGWSDDEW